MADHRLKVSVEGGKYTVIMAADGSMHALRYDEPWQDLTGNNLVYALAAEVESLRTILAETLDAVCEPERKNHG